MSIVLITALFALLLAFVIGVALGFFKEFFAVAEDPLVGKIRAELPGANCGACGFPGCDGYAAAVAKGDTATNCCTVGGATVAKAVSALLGVDAVALVPQIAVLACRGSREVAPVKGEYTGIPTCRGAKLSTGGTKLCAWGCLGYGDCVAICKFGALSMGANGLPRIDPTRCTGCKACVGECPQMLLQAIPENRAAPLPFCSNRNPVKAMVMKTCKSGCIKCELCVKNCPEHCITLDRGLPVIDAAKCTACGTCVSKCPTKVLSMIQNKG
ncbi:MAG: RnfABCDGE type electron transport complex subunit B [Treponema sp.]|jgi:Na+-translocating ferredoxin:NAD+ oxidoreductase RNF subunit RnfB|nr:RnfABCDGE type electron transport complex subunit B [Treponema sp.]